MVPLGKTTPSIEFPVGAVIEDPTTISEILYKFPVTRIGHLYKVKVLKWKLEVPQRIKQSLEKPDEMYICVLEENIANIRRIS